MEKTLATSNSQTSRQLPADSVTKGLFGMAMFLAGFLLFQIQPIVAKAILPLFGGGPTIWTSSLIFFQVAYLAGNLYAYASFRFLKYSTSVVLQGALVLAALCFLARFDGSDLKAKGVYWPPLQIIVLLLCNVGIYSFLLSSASPMLQAWFCRIYANESPYQLYVSSNIGSLAALVTYPFVFEVMVGLHWQLTIWKYCFVVFAIILAICGFRARVLGCTETQPIALRFAQPIDLKRKTWWFLLPAFTSWMLVATSHQLAQDVGVVPLLWILPLSMYLVSFIISFDEPKGGVIQLGAVATIGLVPVCCILQLLPTHLLLIIVVYLATLLAVCLLCHGELVRLKPPSDQLTQYYLLIASGSALGGLVVGLFAAKLFSSNVEWKVGLVGAFCVASVLFAKSHHELFSSNKTVAGLASGVGVALLSVSIGFLGSYETSVSVARTSFGVVSVVDSSNGSNPVGTRSLLNGRVLHGQQFSASSDSRKLTTYYVESSGVGKVFQVLGDRKDLRVGVMGLGAGTLAAYGRFSSQLFRFYEINPEVCRAANTYFTFLGESNAKIELVIGDGRLSLQNELPNNYDILVLDAFSGDSIPSHLLTLEAMTLYLGHLSPDGVIAVHITNRFLDLSPVVRGVSHRVGLKTIECILEADDQSGGLPSAWILCCRGDGVYSYLRGEGTSSPEDRELVWTDDHCSLLSVMKFR